jgi:signal peptidase I
VKKPYIKLYRQLGPYSVWIVDGEWLRKNKDIDFTNFGYHGDKPYIPDKEWWLDVDLGVIEYRFYLENVMTRYFAVKEGATTDEARILGDKAEKKERAKANPSKYKNISSEDIKKKYVGKIGDVNVYIVAGDEVRVLDEDYAEGGHDIVYPYVKPSYSIWLDDSLKKKAYRLILVHEFYERSMMAFGMKYERAHYRASIIELWCRDYPQMTNAILLYIAKNEKNEKALIKLPELLRYGTK